MNSSRKASGNLDEPRTESNRSRESARAEADAGLLDYSNEGSEKDAKSRGDRVTELSDEIHERKLVRRFAVAIIAVFLMIIVLSFVPALSPWVLIPPEVAAACVTGVVFLMIVLLIPAEKLIELIKP